jgi:hypothetical protein
MVFEMATRRTPGSDGAVLTLVGPLEDRGTRRLEPASCRSNAT